MDGLTIHAWHETDDREDNGRGDATSPFQSFSLEAQLIEGRIDLKRGDPTNCRSRSRPSGNSFEIQSGLPGRIHLG